MAELVDTFSYFVTEISIRKVDGEVSRRTQNGSHMHSIMKGV
jgi:hypothetical protein